MRLFCSVFLQRVFGFVFLQRVFGFVVFRVFLLFFLFAAVTLPLAAVKKTACCAAVTLPLAPVFLFFLLKGSRQVNPTPRAKPLPSERGQRAWRPPPRQTVAVAGDVRT